MSSDPPTDQSNLEDLLAAQPLSPEQQAALFVSHTNLQLFASGLQGLAGIDTRTGSLVSVEMTADTAEWAIPYAKRIRDAEALHRGGDISGALSAFQRLQSDLPTAAVVLMNIAVCHADLGDPVAAERWLSAAILHSPPDRRPLLEENRRRLKARLPGKDEAVGQESTPACPKCGFGGVPGDRYCRKCGSQMKLDNRCKHCGSAFQPGDRFCTKCGASLMNGHATFEGTEAREPQETGKSVGNVLKLACPHCREIFRIGEDAFLVTDEDKFRSLSQANASVIMLGRATRKPDLAMRWTRPTTPTERKEQARVAAEIQAAIARGETRQWWCGKCRNEAPNPYPDP